MEQQVDILDSLETPVEIKRNTFITVLCILTWVGCGVMLIWYALVFTVFRLIWDVADHVDFNGVPSTMVNHGRWLLIYYIVAAFCIIPCVIGSILIWRMKVSGFVIYIIGEAIPVLLGFFVAFNGSRMGLGEIFSAIFSSVVPIGFIVMYAINLKSVRVPSDGGFN